MVLRGSDKALGNENFEMWQGVRDKEVKRAFQAGHDVFD